VSAGGEKAIERPVAAPFGTMRDWLREPSTLVAAALILIGIMFIYAEGLSASRVYWTGHTTVGTIRGGLVYYHVHGELYTIVTDKAPTRPTPVTVYYEPSDPSQALLYRSANRWVEGGGIVVWFVAAAACLIVAPVRRRRNRRRGDSEPDWARTYLVRHPPQQ